MSDPDDDDDLLGPDRPDLAIAKVLGHLGRSSDAAKLEHLRMSATAESRAMARRLVLAIMRAGFERLRKTSTGMLYGSGTYRIEVPYAVLRGVASVGFISELHQKFDQERARRDAEYGKPKPVDEIALDDGDPDDLIRNYDEGGQPVAGPGAMNSADAGSTPAPPATLDADAGREPDAAIVALEGSSPSIGTPTHQENELAKAKTRKPYAGWDCPKCGMRFKTPGRHAGSCKGPQVTSTDQFARTPAVERTRRRRGETVTTVHASLNGHQQIFDRFEAATTEFTAASADLITIFKSVVGEAAIYKRERDELAAWKQQLSVLLGPKPVSERA